MVIETDNAELTSRAISVDNLENIKTVPEKGRVITTVSSDSLGSMLTTLDDLLVNLKVVDDVLCGREDVLPSED
nr:KEOPS complex subunit Pcc1 [Methanocella sp. CWC-04]